MENAHLTDSEHCITVVQISGASIIAASKAATIKSMEAEAYCANYFLSTAEHLMTDVTQAMFPRPDLI